MSDSPLLARIPALSPLWQAGHITAAEYASLYFIYWQIARHGRSFAARKHKTAPKPDPTLWLADLQPGPEKSLTPLLLTRLDTCQFKGIIPNVPAALTAWLRGTWPITLLERIPTPQEVLNLQVAGTRPVTLIPHYPRLLEPVLQKTDGQDFMVHDLEHAYKFFQDARLHGLQRHFFALLVQAEQQGLLLPLLPDPVYDAQIDYLISDMNTHPVHGLRFLAASLVEHLLRLESKTTRETLSASGEQTLNARLQQLARCWNFSQPAEAAVVQLPQRDFGTSAAAIIEAELIRA